MYLLNGSVGIPLLTPLCPVNGDELLVNRDKDGERTEIGNKLSDFIYLVTALVTGLVGTVPPVYMTGLNDGIRTVEYIEDLR